MLSAKVRRGQNAIDKSAVTKLRCMDISADRRAWTAALSSSRNDFSEYVSVAARMASSALVGSRCARESTLRVRPVSAMLTASPSATQRRWPPATVIALYRPQIQCERARSNCICMMAWRRSCADLLGLQIRAGRATPTGPASRFDPQDAAPKELLCPRTVAFVRFEPSSPRALCANFAANMRGRGESYARPESCNR